MKANCLLAGQDSFSGGGGGWVGTGAHGEFKGGSNVFQSSKVRYAGYRGKPFRGF